MLLLNEKKTSFLFDPKAISIAIIMKKVRKKTSLFLFLVEVEVPGRKPNRVAGFRCLYAERHTQV
jgi:hypothetical protein